MSELVEKVQKFESMSSNELAQKRYDLEKDFRNFLLEKKLIIASEGNIGLGKSMIIKVLENYGIDPFYELDNKGLETLDQQYNIPIDTLLAKYYSDKKMYSHQLQKVFFERRACQLRTAYSMLNAGKLLEKMGKLHSERMGSVGFDRIIYADRLVFTEVLHDQGNFDDWYYNEYLRYFDSEVKNLPQPDLLVLLKGTPEFAMKMIQCRNRDFEKIEEEEKGTGITLEFLTQLGGKFDTFEADMRKNNYYHGPILVVDREKVNPVTKIPDALAFLECIMEKLGKSYS